MYLSKELINGFAYSESFEDLDVAWKRPHELWAHANNILTNNSGNFYLIDAISTLKRSVDIRIKNLDDVYNLKAVNSNFKKKNKYERLSELSIIRPVMLGKLLEIRNKIEHQDTDPPSLSICEELLDFVWYFLKSTDFLTKNIVNSFVLSKEENSVYELIFEPIMEDWNFSFYGWIQPDLFSEIPKEGYFKIKVKEIGTKDEFISKRRLEARDQYIDDLHSDKQGDDLFIRGGLINDEEIKLKLVYRYFQLNYS